MKQKKIKPQQIPSFFDKVPPIDCNKPAFKHLKHMGKSFVTMDSRMLPRVWEK